jgi:glycogen debranching enzyme
MDFLMYHLFSIKLNKKTRNAKFVDEMDDQMINQIKAYIKDTNANKKFVPYGNKMP